MNLEISLRHAGGDVKSAVGYMNMELRDDVLAGAVK